MPKNHPVQLNRILISDGEQLSLEVMGIEFLYRRIRPIEKTNINKQCRVKGEIDYLKSSIEQIKLCIIDWGNVVDESGKPVKWNPDYVESMADITLAKLLSAINGDPEGGAEITEKNFLTTQE